jgi:hypothetical protein
LPEALSLSLKSLFRSNDCSESLCFSCFSAGFSGPSVIAQDHVAAGAFADYYRLSQTNTNFAGFGGEIGVSLGHRAMLEAETSYDFDQVFAENFDNGGSITANRSNIRLLHGLFGPKFALGHYNFHPFIAIKGGFLNPQFDAAPANLGSFISSV